MNIDQRLDRLTERHEALLQTVELMAHMNEEAHQKNQVLMEKTQILLANVVESIDSLARIAHAHERRIFGLEEGRA